MSINNELVKNDAARTVMSRIALKIDTWANWKKEDVEGQYGNLILHAGEVAFVQMGTVPPVPGEGGESTSNVLFKVGDGIKAFKELPWGSAIAADVYGWAKQDAEAFKAWLNGDAGFATDAEVAAIQTALNEALVALNKKVDEIQIPSLAGYATETFVTDADNALKAALIGGGYGADSGEEGGDSVGPLATTIAEAAAMADAAQTAANNAQIDATDAQSKVNTLIGKDANKSIRDIANEELAAKLIPADAQEALDTLEEIAAWIQQHPDDAAEINRLLSGLGSVTVGEGETAETKAKTVKEYVDGVIAAEQTARADAITNAIDGLDFSELAISAGETLSAIKQENGVLTAQKQSINITKSQISDFVEGDYAEAGHDHDDAYADITAFNRHVTDFATHTSKAITTETYVLFDCGTSRTNID